MTTLEAPAIELADLSHSTSTPPDLLSPDADSSGDEDVFYDAPSHNGSIIDPSDRSSVREASWEAILLSFCHTAFGTYKAAILWIAIIGVFVTGLGTYYQIYGVQLQLRQGNASSTIKARSDGETWNIMHDILSWQGGFSLAVILFVFPQSIGASLDSITPLTYKDTNELPPEEIPSSLLLTCPTLVTPKFQAKWHTAQTLGTRDAIFQSALFFYTASLMVQWRRTPITASISGLTLLYIYARGLVLHYHTLRTARSYPRILPLHGAFGVHVGSKLCDPKFFFMGVWVMNVVLCFSEMSCSRMAY